MNKITLEEASRLAGKYGLDDILTPVRVRGLASLIDEIRGVNVELVTLNEDQIDIAYERYSTALLSGLTSKKAMGRAIEAVSSAPTPSQPELTVWFGSMPESNGKKNWTVLLRRKTPDRSRTSLSSGICFGRSEYYDRERYGADCLRYVIGELSKPPHILDYDEKLKEPDIPAPVQEEITDAANTIKTLQEALSGMLEVFGVTKTHLTGGSSISSTEVEVCDLAREVLRASKGEKHEF